jgi:hypothetical protein
VEDTLIKDKRFALPGRKALLKSDAEYEVILLDASESPIEPDTYTQVMAEGIAAQDVRQLRRSEHRSSLSIRSAIPEEDRSCGRGSRQSGR